MSARIDNDAHSSALLCATLNTVEMDDLASPTTWPIPPTATAAHLLQKQLKALKDDVSELATKTENAANHIADVLMRIRSQDEMGRHIVDEAVSHESELSTTMRDHPFARFSYHDESHPFPSTLSDTGKSARKYSAPPPATKAESTREQQTELGESPIPSALALDNPHRSTYEQSRTFLLVTASMKDETNRAKQCDIVEVS